MSEGIQKILSEPFHIQFVLFFVFSLFCMVVVAGFVSLIFSVRLDRHLKRHHFQVWKMKRGTYQERLSAVLPKDDFYYRETRLHDRIHSWIMAVWIMMVVVMAIVLYINRRSYK